MSSRKSLADSVYDLRKKLQKTSISFRRRLVAAIIFVFMILIMSLDISPLGYLLEVGKQSDRTIRASKTVQYVDKSKTSEQQEAAAAEVKDVYTYDEKSKQKAADGLSEFFREVEEVDALPLEKAEKVKRTADGAGRKISFGTINQILSLDQNQRNSLEAAVMRVVDEVMGEEINQDGLEQAFAKGRELSSRSATDPELQRIVGDLALSFIRPNSFLDNAETQRRKEAVKEAVQAVITTKLQGEVIIEEGEVVTRDQAELLKNLGFKRPTFTPINLVYMAIFVLVLMGAVAMFLSKFRPGIYNSPGLIAVLGGMIMAYVVVAKILNVASSSWSPFWNFLMPSAAVAFIAAVLMDSGVALVMVIVCGLVTGVVTGGNFSITDFAVLGGLFPALMVSRRSSRHELRRMGLYTCFWLALVALSASVLTQVRQDLLLHTGIGFLNGAICTVVAMGTLPFLETAFRVTTNTWLLELASPAQDLLRELSVKAPGTYSHSVMVANLAEAASREVGSDPTLARVAAYYHDVGKIKRPQFFVENQLGDYNPHDSISPNLSTLIITSHVKDGVEMLEKNHIPPDLIEITKQHHGTSLVKFFYDKAMKSKGKEPVEDVSFRYHCEKPHRRTAGILLLADSVEAVARTLDRHSPSAIEQMVERIVDEKMEDGQLDDSTLSLGDVEKIKKVFTKILISAYHPRVDYPKIPGDKASRRKSEDKNNNRVGGIAKKSPTSEEGA